MARQKDYFKYNSYFSLLKSSRKWKELFWGHVALFSVMCSILITTVIILLLFRLSAKEMSELLATFCATLFPGLIGLLGFLISGVALLASLISNKALSVLDLNNCVDSFVELLFSFYFIGSIMGIAIFLLIIDYFLLQFPIPFNMCFFIVMMIFTVYTTIFSLLYTIALLGTCINAFFANEALKNKN